MNRALLIGRNCREVEVRQTASGTTVAKFTVAVDTGYGDNKKTDFIPVTCFGKTAEACEKYLGKGKKVAVEGRINTGSYEKQDGTKVYTTDVLADRIEFLEWASNEPKESNDASQFAGFESTEMDIPF